MLNRKETLSHNTMEPEDRQPRLMETFAQMEANHQRDKPTDLVDEALPNYLLLQRPQPFMQPVYLRTVAPRR